MKEIDQIGKYVGKVHKKFMNVKTTTDDHLMRDLWFTMNVLTMATNNLRRWSLTTSTPDKSFKSMLKAHLKRNKIKLD